MVPQENPRKFAWINTSRKKPSSPKQRQLTQGPSYASQRISKPKTAQALLARKRTVTNENEVTPQVAKRRLPNSGLPTPAATDKPEKGKGKGRAQDLREESRDSPMPLRGGGSLMVGHSKAGGFEPFKVHDDGESSKSKTPISTSRSPTKGPNKFRQRSILRTPSVSPGLSPARRSPSMGCAPVESSEMGTPEPLCGTDTMRRIREINGIPFKEKKLQESPTRKRKRVQSSVENDKSPRKMRLGQGQQVEHRGLPLAEHPSSDNDRAVSSPSPKRAKKAEPYHASRIFRRDTRGISGPKSSPSSRASKKSSRSSTPVRTSVVGKSPASPVLVREPLTPKKTPRNGPYHPISPPPRHHPTDVRTSPTELDYGASHQSFSFPARQNFGGPPLRSSSGATGEDGNLMVYHHESFDLAPSKGIGGGARQELPGQLKPRMFDPVETSETLFTAGNEADRENVQPLSVKQEEQSQQEHSLSGFRPSKSSRSSPSPTSRSSRKGKKPTQTPVRRSARVEAQQTQQSPRLSFSAAKGKEVLRNELEGGEEWEDEGPETLDPALDQTYADNNLFQSHPGGELPMFSQLTTATTPTQPRLDRGPSESQERMPMVATPTKTQSPQQKTPQRITPRNGREAMGQMAPPSLPASAPRRSSRQSQQSRGLDENQEMDEESDIHSSQLGPTQAQGLFETMPRDAEPARSPGSTHTTPTQPMRQSQFSQSPFRQHELSSQAELDFAGMPPFTRKPISTPRGSGAVAPRPSPKPLQLTPSHVVSPAGRGKAVASGEKPPTRKRKQRGEAITPDTSDDVLVSASDGESEPKVQTRRQAAASQKKEEEKSEIVDDKEEDEEEEPKKNAFTVLMGNKRSTPTPQNSGKGKGAKGKGRASAKSTPEASSTRKSATTSAGKRRSQRVQALDDAGQTSLPSQGFFKEKRPRKTEDQIRSFDKAFDEEEDHDFEEEEEEEKAGAGPNWKSTSLSGKLLMPLSGRAPLDPRLAEGGKREVKRRRLVERAQATLKRTPSPLTPLTTSPINRSPLPQPPSHGPEEEEDEDDHPFGEEMRQASRGHVSEYEQSQGTTGSGSQTSGVKTPGSTRNFIDMLGGSSSQNYD
ncbi:hypothetical protein IAR50_003539 [Cryptococcus sp. DSM 104548]